jgi:hypothetical protein
MSTIVTRAGKGSPLTNTEVDSNFTNLNTDKLEINAALGTPVSVTLTNATGLPTAGLVDNAVTDAKLRDSAGLSVIGRGANSTGDPADIVAGTNHQVLRRDGSSLAFGAVDLSSNQAVTGTLPVNQGGTGITSFGSGVATWLGTPTSANLAAAVTDETGTGALVFATSPTLVTPALGTPASGVVTNLTGTASININGTVGATTPAAGAFTTLNTSGAVVFNEAGANVDFRVEGDTEPNLLFVDASADNVGIGTSSPTDKLEVAGVAVAGSAAGGTTGSLVLRSRETLDYTRLSIGTLRSSGASYFGRAVEPSTTVNDGFNGGFTGTVGGGAWIIYDDGSTRFLGLPSGAMTKGSAVSMLERLRITSAGNVGIGTTSPAAETRLAISGTRVEASGNTYRGMLDLFNEEVGTSGDEIGPYISFRGYRGSVTTAVQVTYGAIGGVNEADSTTSAGGLSFKTKPFGGTTDLVERMRIDSSGNVGIGTASPDANLTVNGAASFAAGTALLPSIARAGDLNTGFWFPAADTIAASTAGSERLRIDSSGNLGLGVTPSAWGSTWKAIQVGMGGSIFARTADQNRIGITANAFFDTAFKYIGTGQATLYDQDDGGHFWYTAPSGTAGNAITFTEAMRLTAAGNLGLGATTPISLLEVQGGLTTTGAVVTLSSKETSTVANDVLGRVNFRAALDAAGGDAILTGASIVALAEGTFSATSNATSLLFQTGSSEAATTKMTLTSAGNVGIGTSSPGANLAVNGSSGLIVQNSSATGSQVVIGIGTLTANFPFIGTNTSTNALEIGTRAAVATIFVTNSTEKMRITSAGNVGIGESAPDYKLDVNGTFGFTPGDSVTPADNGDVVFELTNNTTLTVKAKGSDGVVRSGTILLV